MDTATADKYLKELFDIDFLSATRKGYQVPRGSHWWNHNGMRSKTNRYEIESPDVLDAAWIYGRLGEYRKEREKLVKEAKEAGRKLIGWFIVPRWRAVKDIPDLMPQEDMREILKAHDRFCLVDCVCMQDDREHDCGLPLQKCMTFDRGAAFRIDERKDGKELTLKGALDFLDELGKGPIISAPMAAMVKDVKDINSICNCHWDCCLAMTQWYMPGSEGKANDFLMKTRFRATVDPEKCIGCRTCIDGFCQFYAAKMKYYPEFGEERAYIDEDECIGCGQCVENCPVGARGMKAIAGPEYYADIPEDAGAGGGGLNVEKLLAQVETQAEKKKEDKK
ncbi:4Fe-4S binding protein [Chloroflexota bacterium]